MRNSGRRSFLRDGLLRISVKMQHVGCWKISESNVLRTSSRPYGFHTLTTLSSILSEWMDLCFSFGLPHALLDIPVPSFHHVIPITTPTHHARDIFYIIPSIVHIFTYLFVLHFQERPWFTLLYIRQLHFAFTSAAFLGSRTAFFARLQLTVSLVYGYAPLIPHLLG